MNQEDNKYMRTSVLGFNRVDRWRLPERLWHVADWIDRRNGLATPPQVINGDGKCAVASHMGEQNSGV